MLKRLLILPALALGVLAVVLLVRGRKAHVPEPPHEVAKDVRAFAVPRLAVQPRAVGYGVVRPGRVWQAVPQVGGRLTELYPHLREGNFIEEGTVLLKIETSDPDLEVLVGRARLEALDAQIEELDARRGTLEATLEIEQRSLELAKAELARIKSLVDSASLPQADQDREERTVLTQSLRVQEIQNAVQLLAPQRKMLQAQVAQETSNIEKALLAIERSVITAPFRGRLGPVDLEKEQVVQPGKVLFRLDGIETAEVTAQIPMLGVRQVITAGAADFEPTELSVERLRELGLRGRIRLAAGASAFQWDADVVRARGIDVQTRTVGIDVSAPDPYGGGAPAKRPPLVRGMYVEVEIRGRLQPDLVVVPRYALHDDHVYLVDEDSRLVRQPVEIRYVQGQFAVVKTGLEGGEILVISDLVPAAQGMLIHAVTDPEALRALRADAAGEASLR